MAILEHTIPDSQNIGNHCPMLDDPADYEVFSMNIQGREVTIIPAESFDIAPTTYTQGCIETGVSAIPCTFACNVCRRHGAVGN